MKSNHKNTYSYSIFRNVWRRFLLQIAIITICFLGFSYFIYLIYPYFDWHSIQNTFLEPFYSFLRTTYYSLPYLLILLWCFVFFFLLRRSWKKSLAYIDSIAEACNRLVDHEDTFISLPAQLSGLAIQMNQLKQEAMHNEALAKENEQRKNDLIVYLAHDLKTPLTSIIGYLQLLKESPDLPLEQRAKYTNITLEKAYRLEDLMNEFFEIARFNDTTITLMKRELQVKLMLEQIVDEFFPVLTEQNKMIDITCGDSILLFADPDKLSRAINNIIKNAVSYSFEHTTILITALQKEERIEISIQNTGYTIPPDKLHSIFEKFYRLDDARSSHTGGAGLGLAIAKELIELHDGSIQATSIEGITTFTICLPARKGNPQV